MSKPIAHVTDGNIFSVISAATTALHHAGQADKAKEMRERATHSNDYMHTLSIIEEYVEIDTPDMEENVCEQCGETVECLVYSERLNMDVCDDCYDAACAEMCEEM